MKCFREEDLVVWGDGTAIRDFLFAGDIAEALLLAAERLQPPAFVNIGSQSEITVRQLVELITRFTCFRRKVTYDLARSAVTPGGGVGG